MAGGCLSGGWAADRAHVSAGHQPAAALNVLHIPNPVSMAQALPLLLMHAAMSQP